MAEMKIATEDCVVVDDEGTRRFIAAGSPIPYWWPDQEPEPVEPEGAQPASPKPRGRRKRDD